LRLKQKARKRLNASNPQDTSDVFLIGDSSLGCVTD